MTAPGEPWRPDPDEWLRIAGGQLKPVEREVEGRRLRDFEIRFANALEEVTYLDQARLVAVDHPTGAAVYPGERMVNDPRNRAPVLFYLLERARPIVRAAGGSGQDLTAALAEIDRNYAGPLELLPFKGFAREWSLLLDLGGLEGSKPVLLLHGWIRHTRTIRMSNILRNKPKVGPAVIATLKVKYKSARPWVIVTKIVSFLMTS